MLYQAAFFERHPDSPFVGNADNVQYAYNEFLHIAINIGLIGTALIALFLFSCLTVKSDDPSNKVLKLAFGSLLFFSFFSYPLSVLRLFLLFVVSALLLDRRWDYLNWMRGVANMLLVIILIGGVSYYSIDWYLKRTCLSLFAEETNSRIKAERTIEKNYRIMKYYPDNIDRYAAYCVEKNRPQKHRVLQDVARLAPSCEAYTEMGKMLLEEGDKPSAIVYYHQASYMIPLKISPRYQLFLLYWNAGDYDSALKVEREILELPIKVRSSDAIIMLSDVKKKCETLQMNNNPSYSCANDHE